MAVTFWLCAALAGYVYVGYPALLVVWSRVRGPKACNRTTPSDSWPSVSIVIAVRNEAQRLPGRLNNLVNLAYAGARQIVVVSDGSTDATAEALRPYADAVDFISIDAAGKAAALNAGVSIARHDLLVFADARQTFAIDALFELARPFADPQVGAVSGELILEQPEMSGTADGLGLYWRLEKRIRELESDVDSMVGATGAIYAVRRSLWTPLPVGTILDDVLVPMRCVMQGQRVVFNRLALAFDRVADSAAEARRKRRTHAGNYQLLALEPRLLAPWRNRLWLQYVSHKLGRLLVPYALIGLFISSASLASASAAYAIAFSAQCGFYLLAGLGAFLELADRARTRSALSLGRSWR
ncbi:MAG TPA: glycosyltransferase [Vicinamibacterales bacterium]|jgi:cellulose synthase/poly-beta-1,6-N-acetylglucosamine synthase-like glycosyltransferase